MRKIYHVTTKKKTYNDVSSPNTFRTTRKITKDTSAVVHAQRWNNNAQAWIPAGKKQFEYRK